MILRRLKESASRYCFYVIAYTFMPDHLHILVRGEEGSDLKRFGRHFKQTSGYDFKKRHGEPLWHLSYYDHILRKDEDIMATARYILENPVRKGLVKEFRDYPFSGSFEYDVAEML